MQSDYINHEMTSVLKEYMERLGFERRESGYSKAIADPGRAWTVRRYQAIVYFMIWEIHALTTYGEAHIQYEDPDLFEKLSWFGTYGTLVGF